MNFRKHSEFEGYHAFLGASKYYWINYDDEKLANAYRASQAAARGTRLHEFAKECILLGQKLPRNKNTLNMYVNDAIGYKMTPEQVLFYSENCFGTCDSISYRNGVLRIHDFKSGETPAHIEQLHIYAALFFLEYGEELKHSGVKLDDIYINLRIYQSNEVIFDEPDFDDISILMNRIVNADKIISRIKEEENRESL